MPRSGSTYTLPSPPAPLVAGALAKAEDLNTIQNDIATALTNSVATDGSTPLGGDLNLNNHNVTGGGTITGFVLHATGSLVSDFDVDATGNVNVGGTINADGNVNANAVGVTSLLTASSITCSGPINGNNLAATQTVSGGTLYSSGNINAVGNIATTNVVQAGVVNCTGTVFAAAFHNTVTGGTFNVGGLSALEHRVAALEAHVRAKEPA